MRDNLELFLDSSEIRAMTNQLAKRISSDYQKVLLPDEEILVVVTLKGAIYFASDLVRALTIPSRIDFVRVSSYGAGTKSSGVVRILKDIESNLPEYHVLVLDEIVDSGHTLSFLRNRLETGGAKSVRCCSLLSKPSRREVQVDVEYCGKEVEDKFLVGYGLDYQERYRNLSDICFIPT